MGAEIVENIDSNKVTLQNICHPLLFLTRQGLLITSILYYWFKREDRRDLKCLLVNYTTLAEDNGKKTSSDTGHLGLPAPTERFKAEPQCFITLNREKPGVISWMSPRWACQKKVLRNAQQDAQTPIISSKQEVLQLLALRKQAHAHHSLNPVLHWKLFRSK